MKFFLNISLILATLALCSCTSNIGKRSISGISGLLSGGLGVNANAGANIYAGVHGYANDYGQYYDHSYAPNYGGHYATNRYGGNTPKIVVYKVLNNAGITGNYGAGYYPNGVVKSHYPFTAIQSVSTPVKFLKVIPATSAYLGANYVNSNSHSGWHSSGYYGGDWNQGW